MSGYTANVSATFLISFCFTVIELLRNREETLKTNEIGALILSPTRELAIQINAVLDSFIDDIDLTSALIVGGKSKGDAVKKLTNYGGQIIIATPGKFTQMLENEASESSFLQKALKSLEILILDEADRFFQQANFREALKSILSHLPKQRRTSLFSATQTTEIETFIRAGLRNPVQVIVREKRAHNALKRTPDSLNNFYLICDADQKLQYLITLLRAHREQKFIIFFNTCACVDYFSKLLVILLKTIPVLSIHGQKAKRADVFCKFQDMKSGILACTDVMARGIDIPTVDWVIQYDPPSNVEAFVHRCGRTARAGNFGNALLFLLPSESAYVEFVKINQKVPIEEFTHEQTLDTSYNMAHKIRRLATQDRELYEKGLRAFVSFIQSYLKHQCNIILQVKELDICKLAYGFGLLHLPLMPELKNMDVSAFSTFDIDTNTIRFKDKNREKARIERDKKKTLEKQAHDGERKKMKESWSKEKEKKNKKAGRKEKKDLKRKHNAVRCQEENEDGGDVDELLREARLMKKLKRGKISKQQFQQQLNEQEEEEDED